MEASLQTDVHALQEQRSRRLTWSNPLLTGAAAGFKDSGGGVGAGAGGGEGASPDAASVGGAGIGGVGRDFGAGVAPGSDRNDVDHRVGSVAVAAASPTANAPASECDDDEEGSFEINFFTDDAEPEPEPRTNGGAWSPMQAQAGQGGQDTQQSYGGGSEVAAGGVSSPAHLFQHQHTLPGSQRPPPDTSVMQHPVAQQLSRLVSVDTLHVWVTASQTSQKLPKPLKVCVGGVEMESRGTIFLLVHFTPRLASFSSDCRLPPPPRQSASSL